MNLPLILKTIIMTVAYTVATITVYLSMIGVMSYVYGTN